MQKDQISTPLLNAIEISLDTIFKASGTEIRVHNIENVPDQSVLYVINHFTRIETFMVPNIIRKKLKKYPISLADSSFYSGKMGEFMAKVGAVSTADPNRDRVLIYSLLTDRYPVIIFPEGQMIKDKKLIEKGKFMVYNTGIRRPPHTGAAQIAIRTQFIREKIRHFHARGDQASLASYAAEFQFDMDELDAILKKDTVIVPVNLTYFPIRAKNNAIKKLVNRFVKGMSERFEEELEVEGTMVAEGVDIDMNFGTPISVKDYLHRNKKIAALISDDNRYVGKEEFRSLKAFHTMDIAMMHEYMESIYGMTTVNHDHLLAYIIMRYPKNRIDENDFKNRAFLAIEKLRRTGITNCHSSLGRKQFYFLTDDYHDKYNSFIETGVAEGLISVKNGVITRNAERFSKLYDFHTIRKDNIFEVLKNEIEPLSELVRELNRLMMIPPFFIRRKIRNHFIELDQRLFDQDYRQFHVEGESKPEHIGRPFFLRRFFSKKGVILVHGYMAAPEEIRPLAEFLHKKGYNVYGARLRGHGTAPEDLAIRNWEKFYDSASRAYIIMKNSVRKIAIGGFSTGAGVALLQAANKPGCFAGVISINAPLKLQNISSRLSTVVVMWNKFLGRIRMKKGKMEFVTNTPENPDINYFRNPVSGVNELEKLMKEVEDHLKYVVDPALIIQGSDDPVVNPVSGLEIFERLGTSDKKLLRIYATHHGILRGGEANEVQACIYEFLKKVMS